MQPDSREDAGIRRVRENFERALGGEMRAILSAIKAAEIAGFADDISPLERRTYV